LIPPRIRLRGDVDKAEALLGFAKDQLKVLHRSMKFQGLEQLKRKVTLVGEAAVKLSSSFGLDTIEVYVPIVPVEEEVEVEEEEIEIIEVEPLGAASKTAAGPAGLTLVSDECCPSINKVEVSCPGTIEVNHTENLVATSGCPPYTWAVAGTDYHLLDGAEGTGENGEFNRLYLGGSGAGSGTVTVTDDCSDEAVCVVGCVGCGYWSNTEDGESAITGDPGCDQCYLGDAEDEGNNDCNHSLTCYSQDGKERWTMSQPACMLDWEECTCTCDCWGDWTIYNPGNGDHGDPAQHPPNCAGYDNTPCGLNLRDCGTCMYGGSPYDCMSCVYRRYDYYEWIDTT